MRLPLFSAFIVAAFLALPSGAFATTVSVQLTEVLLDDEEDGTDLSLLGILPKLETAFPQARGYRLVETERSGIARGSEASLRLGDETWRVVYLGDKGEYHRLEIESPTTLQTVRAVPGSTFFFATRNSDSVVAVTVDSSASRPKTTRDRAPLPSDVKSSEEGSTNRWALGGAVVLAVLVLLLALARRVRA